jgi:hypothetical protein
LKLKQHIAQGDERHDPRGMTLAPPTRRKRDMIGRRTTAAVQN